MDLDDLGVRIGIMGPSNSGKSTLAEAIGRARGLQAIHLDRLRHLPNTNYQMRSDAEFVALHDEAIKGPKWVMDGNYSICLPQRLERATGLILLDIPVAISLFRNLRRTWLQTNPPGALEGGKANVGLEMFKHITKAGPINRKRHRQTFDAADLPKIFLGSTREITEFTRAVVGPK